MTGQTKNGKNNISEIRAAFVEGAARSVSRNSGWYVHRVVDDGTGFLQTTPLQFIEAAAGRAAVDAALARYRTEDAEKTPERAPERAWALSP